MTATTPTKIRSPSIIISKPNAIIVVKSRQPFYYDTIVRWMRERLPMTSSATIDLAVGLLGPLEGRIMRSVWCGELPQPFVVRAVQRLRPKLAYTTLMTTVNRLAEKRILEVEQIPGQKAYSYRASGTPYDFLDRASRERASRVREQMGDAALAAFAAQLEDLTPKQVERLRRAARDE